MDASQQQLINNKHQAFTGTLRDSCNSAAADAAVIDDDAVVTIDAVDDVL